MTIRSRARGAFLAVALSGLLAGGCQDASAPGEDAAASPAGLVDVRGRPIQLRGALSQIAIDDARYLVALGLIHPDPGSLLVAWPQDVNRLGEETYQQFLAKSPGLATLPKVASSAGSFDLESLLAAKPQLALLSLESNVTDTQVAQLEAAGITVAFVDFFVQPLKNLERSLLLLGEVTGRQRQAQEFVQFRRERMDRIAKAVATLPAADRPTVFLEAHAGMGGDCCNSPGRGNIGDYLSFVGGHNIGADVIEQSFGKLNLEYVISRDPAVYIGTGGPHLAKANGLVLGAAVSPEQARAALARVTARPGIAGLSAVRSGNAHGFSHQLINSPLDIVAVETFAKWLHPDLFADLDPAATLDTINRRFLAVPYRGTFWVDLPASSKE
ncbi:ABC transporter substrate-binding protein [Croceibacterium ferulae]|uniref:ABC transporter substrate-binding protein n=1 Tax=Croceibacterium ferulae TaxID=1854641 RepID=UPI000EAF2A45|nr:ABC transporter substrate-binding protein [Croceibacterium ferulae]